MLSNSSCFGQALSPNTGSCIGGERVSGHVLNVGSAAIGEPCETLVLRRGFWFGAVSCGDQIVRPGTGGGRASPASRVVL